MMVTSALLMPICCLGWSRFGECRMQMGIRRARLAGNAPDRIRQGKAVTFDVGVQ